MYTVELTSAIERLSVTGNESSYVTGIANELRLQRGMLLCGEGGVSFEGLDDFKITVATAEPTDDPADDATVGFEEDEEDEAFGAGFTEGEGAEKEEELAVTVEHAEQAEAEEAEKKEAEVEQEAEQEAEAQALHEAEEKIRLEAAEMAKNEAEEKAMKAEVQAQEADEKAKEAEEKAAKEAEVTAKEEDEEEAKEDEVKAEKAKEEVSITILPVTPPLCNPAACGVSIISLYPIHSCSLLHYALYMLSTRAHSSTMHYAIHSCSLLHYALCYPLVLTPPLCNSMQPIPTPTCTQLQHIPNSNGYTQLQRLYPTP
jgi:chemotaxis protein histidine kinase CheA